MKTLLWIIGIAALVLIVWAIWHNTGSSPTSTLGENSTSTGEMTSSADCVVGDCPFDLYKSDNGKTFTYVTTSRFTIHLDNSDNPIGNLKCTPEGIIGSVASEPYTTAGAYNARFEAVHEGTCILTDDNFHATIRVYQEPNAS